MVVKNLGNGWGYLESKNPGTISDVRQYTLELGETPSMGKDSITTPIKAIKKAHVYVPGSFCSS